jgi:hypothetical protein
MITRLQQLRSTRIKVHTTPYFTPPKVTAKATATDEVYS